MASVGFCTSLPFNRAFSKHKAPIANSCSMTARVTRSDTVSVISRASATIAASALFAFSCVNPATAIISVPPCVKGEGPGCDVNAAESPVIRELLEKSRANKAKNDKETLERYWQQGYGDYFSYGYNKDLVKGEDGKWRLEKPKGLLTGIQQRMEALAKKDK